MVKSSPEQAAGRLEQLIREANGTIGEMSRLLRECRQLMAVSVREHRDACAQASDEELRKWYEKMQDEMNRNSALLNEAVTAARKVVIRQLTARVLPAEKGLRIRWGAGLFEEDAEVKET